MNWRESLSGLERDREKKSFNEFFVMRGLFVLFVTQILNQIINRHLHSHRYCYYSALSNQEVPSGQYHPKSVNKEKKMELLVKKLLKGIHKNKTKS